MVIFCEIYLYMVDENMYILPLVNMNMYSLYHVNYIENMYIYI